MPLGPQVSKLKLDEDIIRYMLVIGVNWELHDFKISILAAIMHACGPRNILVCLKKLVRCNEILNKDIIYLLLPLSLSLSLFFLAYIIYISLLLACRLDPTLFFFILTKSRELAAVIDMWAL